MPLFLEIVSLCRYKLKRQKKKKRSIIKKAKEHKEEKSPKWSDPVRGRLISITQYIKKLF